MTIEVGSTIEYRSRDGYNCRARVLRVNELAGTIVIEYGDMRETIDIDDVYFVRGDRVRVGNRSGRVTQVDLDGDLRVRLDDGGSEFFYRTKVDK